MPHLLATIKILYALLAFWLSFPLGLLAQEQPQPSSLSRGLPEQLEKAATPKGGMPVFYRFLEEHMEYPAAAASAEIQGDVLLKFFIQKEGRASAIEVEQGIDAEIDEEAIRLVELFGEHMGWKPVEKEGVLVLVERFVTVRFRLHNASEDNLKTGASTASLIIEREALPNGNMQAFYDFLAKNITYPKEAIKHRIEGTAYIRFIIDENGNVEWAEAVEGREVGYGIDEEAIRVLKMTKWTPGRHQGRTVQQRKILPITFSLPQEKPKKRKG
jgi:TonB family protein